MEIAKNQIADKTGDEGEEEESSRLLEFYELIQEKTIAKCYNIYYLAIIVGLLVFGYFSY